jgi:hypothetical protein
MGMQEGQIRHERDRRSYRIRLSEKAHGVAHGNQTKLLVQDVIEILRFNRESASDAWPSKA